MFPFLCRVVSISGLTPMQKLSGFVTRDKKTYSCPCAKTGSFNKIPTWESVWPCDLCIVIANAARTGKNATAQKEGGKCSRCAYGANVTDVHSVMGGEEETILGL